MSTLLEKPIKVNRIVTTSVEHARAIEDPARAKIVEILYHQALSAEQITTALKKSGFNMAKDVATADLGLGVLAKTGGPYLKAFAVIRKLYQRYVPFLSRGASTRSY